MTAGRVTTAARRDIATMAQRILLFDVDVNLRLGLVGLLRKQQRILNTATACSGGLMRPNGAY